MKIIDTEIKGVYMIFCPGCKCGHWFSTNGNTPNHIKGNEHLRKGPVWGWNGDREKPTIEGSILTRSGPGMSKICHSVITDGKIKYLKDSTHELSGQTVELENFDGV